MSAKKTWKELEAEGIRRCCVIFRSGKRCRRRASDGSSWCSKHGPSLDRLIGYHEEVLKKAEEEMASPRKEEVE